MTASDPCEQIQSWSVAATLEVIGGKWMPMIMYAISIGDHRFGLLLRKIEGISRKVLSQQLRELEGDSIILRRDDGALPFRVAYGLTEKGQSLQPVGNNREQVLRTRKGPDQGFGLMEIDRRVIVRK